MFYVLFIPYCNYDDSYINSRSLINFTPYRTWSLGLFCRSVKLHILQVEDIQFILKYLQFPAILIVKPEKACSCAYVCKLSIWLPTSTVSGVQRLFSGEIWCSQLINSEITEPCFPKCPDGKGISNPLSKKGSSAPREFPHLFSYSKSSSIK